MTVMKKAIIGLAAVGAVIGLGPVVKRRIGHKMRAHCQQIAAKCHQMMAGQSPERGEAAGMPEHCKQVAAQLRADKGPAETREQSEQEAPRFVSHAGAVGTA
jgi:hypothetical protein